MRTNFFHSNAQKHVSLRSKGEDVRLCHIGQNNGKMAERDSSDVIGVLRATASIK